MFTDINCFNEQTFLIQCTYGELAYNYKWKLVLGINDNKMKRNLLVWQRMIQLVIKWDPSDIGKTKDFVNSLTESQISDILYKLNHKMNV
jgi:hypothetical protein